MKKYINERSLSNFKSLAMAFFVSAVTIAVLASCDEELPTENSKPDETPPEAGFSYTVNEADYLQLSFTNLSSSATDYVWDFGDGTEGSTDEHPIHTYASEGAYTVTLIASDKLLASDTISQDIILEEPEDDFVPVILNPGFDIEGEDSYRDHWRNGDLGGVLQITSSPVHEGEKAAKFPSAGDRIAYQLITVQKDKDYVISFYYTMKTTPVGTLTVSILAGDVTDPDAVADATIASVDLNDQSDDSTYILSSVSFNSGDNTEVAIYVTNVDVECRIDTFSIVEE